MTGRGTTWRTAALAVLTCVLWCLPGPASTLAAAGPGSMSVGDGVAYANCFEHPFSYAVEPMPHPWRLEVSLLNEAGEELDFLAIDNARTGTAEVSFCLHNEPGVYRLVASRTWVDQSFATQEEPLPVVSFQLSPPKTRTSIAVSDRRPRVGQPVVFRIISTVETPQGYGPNAVAQVRLQGRIKGSGWVDAKGGKALTRGSDGVATIKFRWTGRTAAVKFRARTVAGATVASTSSAVWVRTARGSDAGPRTWSRAAQADPGARPGAYKGTTQGHYALTFTVNRTSTRITGFDTSVVAYCIGAAGPTGPTVWRAAVPTIKLSRAGTFDRTFTVAVDGRKTTIRVRGDLDNARLTKGTLEYVSTVDGNTCETDGPQPLTARRR